MCAYDAARDGKTQARATGSSVSGFLTTIKALEDVRDILGADAFTRIADGHFHARACSAHPDADSPSRRRVPQCIADQVIEHAAYCLCIHEDRVNIGFSLSLQCNILLLCKLGKTFKGIRNKIIERRFRA